MAKFFQEWNEYAVKHVPARYYLGLFIFVMIAGSLVACVALGLSVWLLIVLADRPQWYVGIIFAVFVPIMILIMVFGGKYCWRMYKRAKEFEQKQRENGQENRTQK